MHLAALEAHMERKYSLLTRIGRKIWNGTGSSTCCKTANAPPLQHGCMSTPRSGSSVVTEPLITLPLHGKPHPRRFRWPIAIIWYTTWLTLSNCSWLAVGPRFAEPASSACQKMSRFLKCRPPLSHHLRISGGNSQRKTSGTRLPRPSGGARGPLSTDLRSARGIRLMQTEIARRVGISTYQGCAPGGTAGRCACPST